MIQRYTVHLTKTEIDALATAVAHSAEHGWKSPIPKAKLHACNNAVERMVTEMESRLAVGAVESEGEQRS